MAEGKSGLVSTEEANASDTAAPVVSSPINVRSLGLTVLAIVAAWGTTFATRLQQARASARETYANLWHELADLEQRRAAPRDVWTARVCLYLYPAITWLVNLTLPEAAKYLRLG